MLCSLCHLKTQFTDSTKNLGTEGIISFVIVVVMYAVGDWAPYVVFIYQQVNHQVCFICILTDHESSFCIRVIDALHQQKVSGVEAKRDLITGRNDGDWCSPGIDHWTSTAWTGISTGRVGTL